MAIPAQQLGKSFPPDEIPELASLRAAIEWARIRRIRIAPSAPPVECISGHHPRWGRRNPDSVIDPIGAAILQQQPDVGDLQMAAALALGTSISVAEGLADGLAGDKPDETWIVSPVKARYGAAYLAGVELRTVLSTWACSFHRVRMPLGENCPACLKGLS